jgi:hypothetical protein
MRNGVSALMKNQEDSFSSQALWNRLEKKQLRAPWLVALRPTEFSVKAKTKKKRLKARRFY